VSGDSVSHKIDRKVRYKVDDPVHQIHEYNIDTKSNHIYLMGETSYVYSQADEEPGVEYAMANRFIKNMNVAMRSPDGQPILIHMKTCGGDWHEGMAIYDMIKACPLPVTILNYTHARSMSSIILQAADKRIMMPHSAFMIHRGSLGFFGEHQQCVSNLEFYKKTEEAMLDIYVNRMKERGCYSTKSAKWTREYLKEQMDSKVDVFFTAEEAVKLGFADEIFGADGNYDWSKLSK